MPGISRFSSFYLLEHLLEDYSSLLDKFYKEDFLFVDISHRFFYVFEDEVRLASFLNKLHSKEINWLLFCFDSQQTRALFDNFQMCSLIEQSKVKEYSMLLIFNCNAVEAAKVFKLRNRRRQKLSPHVIYKSSSLQSNIENNLRKVYNKIDEVVSLMVRCISL